jgi:PhnB protein
MKLIPHLIFSGNCEEAIKFYERCPGGKIEAMINYMGTPDRTERTA